MGVKELFVPLAGEIGAAEERPEASALDMALSMAASLHAHVEAYFCAPPTGHGEAILPAGPPDPPTRAAASAVAGTPLRARVPPVDSVDKTNT